METSLIIKIVIFIILALFASWPYFEQFKEYIWIKRILLAIPILMLIVLGVMDIYNTDVEIKADKKRISDLTDTVSSEKEIVRSMNNKVMKLEAKIDGMKDNENNKFGVENSKLDELLKRKLNQEKTLKIQENNGNLQKALKDTSKK